MKKILFMVNSMNIGGVEKSLLSLISVIPKDKYDITILMLEKKGGFLSDIPRGVKTEEVAWYKEKKPIIMQPPQQTIAAYYKNNDYIKALSFLFIYLISKYFNNRYLYYKHIFNGIPDHPKRYDIAISYQGPTDIIDYYIGHKVHAPKKVSWVHFDVSKHEINKRLYKRLYRKFSKIFVVSKAAQENLIEKVPSISSKSNVFMNIVSEQLINKKSKEIVNFDEGYRGLRIVTVGRLSIEKGQDMAIKVLHKLRQNGYEVRWYCIGDGNKRLEYEQLIEDYGLKENFILLGSQVNPYPYMAQSDIYVQPSRHEGYCLTLAEAKYLHKPIVTTSFIGAYEQIIDGYNGMIVKIDEQKLYEEIKCLLESPKKRHDLSVNLSKTNYGARSEVTKLLDGMEW